MSNESLIIHEMLRIGLSETFHPLPWPVTGKWAGGIPRKSEKSRLLPKHGDPGRKENLGNTLEANSLSGWIFHLPLTISVEGRFGT